MISRGECQTSTLWQPRSSCGATTPKGQGRPGTIRDQKTKPGATIHDPVQSAKPPSPVQIRAALHFHQQNSSFASANANACPPIGLRWTTTQRSQERPQPQTACWVRVERAWRLQEWRFCKPTSLGSTLRQNHRSIFPPSTPRRLSAAQIRIPRARGPRWYSERGSPSWAARGDLRAWDRLDAARAAIVGELHDDVPPMTTSSQSSPSCFDTRAVAAQPDSRAEERWRFVVGPV